MAEDEKNTVKKIHQKIITGIALDQDSIGIEKLKKAALHLRDTWQTVSSETLPKAINETRSLQDAANRSLNTLTGAQLASTRTALKEVLATMEERPTTIPPEVFAQLKESATDSGLIDAVRRTVSEIENTKTLFSQIKTALQFSRVNPSRSGLRIPEAVEVPFFEAPDTHLELSRTSRNIDDRISIFLTVTSSSGTERVEASFIVKQFGWHETLAPSVILSRPIRSGNSTSSDFKFAPAISWLRRNYPRREDKRWGSSISRLIQPGFGLHAAFIDHDPQKSTEIGLGFSASFWKDRLITGVGWNLMDNSNPYFYIGSNLIPVLQSLGFGSSGGGGKKP